MPILRGNRYRVIVISRPSRRWPWHLRIRDRLTGRVVQEVLRGVTERERRRAYDRAAAREEFLNGGPVELAAPVPWGEAKAEGLAAIAARRRPATVACYRHILKRLEEYLPDLAEPGDVTPGVAQHYVAWRRCHVRRVERAAEATINRDLIHLASFWTYLGRLSLAEGNPWAGVDLLRVFRTERTRLSASQLRRLIVAASDMGLAFHAALSLAAETGPRIGELSHVTWGHLDLAAGRWRITREGGWQPKGGRERTVRFSKDSARLLSDHHEAGVARLVGAGMPSADARESVDERRAFGHGRTSVNEAWEREFNGNLKAACRVAGVPVVTCHGLRFTLGRLAADAGAPALAIREFLGHRDFATTERYIGEGREWGADATFEALQGDQGDKQVTQPAPATSDGADADESNPRRDKDL